jgi:hypothetical protein
MIYQPRNGIPSSAVSELIRADREDKWTSTDGDYADRRSAALLEILTRWRTLPARRDDPPARDLKEELLALAHIDLIRREKLDPLLPHLLGFSHRDPHVGMDEVHPLDCRVGVVRYHQPRTGY